MKKHILLFVFALILVAPGLAQACNVTDVDAAFNCDGWNAVVVVVFADGEQETFLDYAVSLLDADENVLEWTGERLFIERPTTGESTVNVPLQGLWQGTYQGSAFYASIAADLDDSDPNGFIEQLQCTVANDNVSWDSVKSQYR